VRGACEAILVRGIVVLVRERRPPKVVHGVGRAYLCLFVSVCSRRPFVITAYARSFLPHFKLFKLLPHGGTERDAGGRSVFCLFDPRPR